MELNYLIKVCLIDKKKKPPKTLQELQRELLYKVVDVQSTARGVPAVEEECCLSSEKGDRNFLLLCAIFQKRKAFLGFQWY